MDLKQITIIKRNVKYPRLELKTGFPILVLPRNGGFNPKIIIRKHQEWLERKMEFIENLKNKYKNQKIYPRKESDLIQLVTKFVDEFSKIIKTKPERVTFRYMKTKWGSCSRRKTVCFNLILRYVPRPLIRYVIFHEMVHLIVPNHSKNFWLNIKKEFKNPERYEKILYGYWLLINNRRLERPQRTRAQSKN